MPTQSSMPKQSLKKKKHLLITIIFAFLFCFLAVVFIVPFFINPIASILIKNQIAFQFGDKLKTGPVGVTFFSGPVIQIRQIQLEQAPGFGKEFLMKAESINVRVALLPLLHKQLLIKNITVVRPEINVIQYQNGAMNLDYYLSMFTANPSSNSSYESNFTVNLDHFDLENGKIIFKSYAISQNDQPTLILTRANLSLETLVMPNPEKIATTFSGSALLGTRHPAPVNFNGTGLFGGAKISFSAKSKITNLTLADYTNLVPGSSVTVTSGLANISSDLNCHNDYLNSYHHVNIRRFKLAPKKGHFFKGFLLGAPANLFIQGIQNSHGRLNFDFTLTGNLSALRVNVKFKTMQAVTQSLREKLGITKINNAAASDLKKVRGGFTNLWKRIFKHQK